MATDPADIELTTSSLTSAQALPSIEIHPIVSSPKPSPPVDSASSPLPSTTSNPLQRSETATSSTTQASTTLMSSSALPDQTSCGPSPGISPNPSLSPTLCNTNTFPMLTPSMMSQPTAAPDQNRPRRFRRPSIQELIGLISLLVACIGLFVYSHRSFVMAKWTAYNDLLTTCAQLEQVHLTHNNPGCKFILDKGPIPPPYLKKNIYKAGYKLGKRAVTFVKARGWYVAGNRDSWFPPPHQTTSVASGHSVFLPGVLSKTATILAMSICLGLAGLVLGFAIMAYMRLRATSQKTQDNATSVRAGVIRTYQPEAESTSVEGPFRVIQHQPRRDPFRWLSSREPVLNQIQRRFGPPREHGEESSSETFGYDSANSSSDTLFNERREQDRNTSRRVSMTLSNGEHRQESLIELECKDGVRNFVDLNTGEEFYIAPWRSALSDAEGSLDEYSFRKPGDIPAGTIKRAIAEMVTGASALAEGKMVEDKIVEKLKAHRIERHVSQKTGDCLAGEVSNQ